MNLSWKFQAENWTWPSDIPRDGYVYLASPYTHDDVYVREERFLQAIRACAYMMTVMGIHATNSIVFTHPILTRYQMPVEWEFWASYDENVIKRCDEVWSLCVPGFTQSKGLNAELAIANKLGKRIRYLIPHINGNGYSVTDACPKEEDLYGKIQAGRLATESL